MRYDGLFHTWQARCLLLLLVVPIAGCTSFFVDPDRTRPRDYELIVKSATDEQILKISCRYIGKSIRQTHGGRSLPAENVDFYEYTFINLSSSSIQFISIHSYSKYRAYFTWYQNHKNEYLDTMNTDSPINRVLVDFPLWEGNRLEAGESRQLKDVFYYSGLPFNIRFHELTFRWRDAMFIATIYELFKFNNTSE